MSLHNSFPYRWHYVIWCRNTTSFLRNCWRLVTNQPCHSQNYSNKITSVAVVGKETTWLHILKWIRNSNSELDSSNMTLVTCCIFAQWKWTRGRPDPSLLLLFAVSVCTDFFWPWFMRSKDWRGAKISHWSPVTCPHCKKKKKVGYFAVFTCFFSLLKGKYK